MLMPVVFVCRYCIVLLVNTTVASWSLPERLQPLLVLISTPLVVMVTVPQIIINAQQVRLAVMLLQSYNDEHASNM
jgi:hypothetical protein